MSKFHSLILIGLLIVIAPQVCRAQPQEPVAVITEMRLKRGDIQLRAAGSGVIERPSVLQSLYPGMQIHASKDASVVILFTKEMKTVTVDEKNSPFEIKASLGKESQPSARIGEIVSLLFGKKKPPKYDPLLVRGKAQPPMLVTPRNTKLMTDSPTFQWMGMGPQPVTVRVYDPEGVLWSAEGVGVSEIKYPPSAPRLKPGIDYFWAIEEKGFPLEKARFTILKPEESRSVQKDMASLNGTKGLSKNTLSILKASLLASHELFHEAREILLEAVNGDRDEPTLHFVLGEIYDKTGLKDLAAAEYGEAEFLVEPRR